MHGYISEQLVEGDSTESYSRGKMSLLLRPHTDNPIDKEGVKKGKNEESAINLAKV